VVAIVFHFIIYNCGEITFLTATVASRRTVISSRQVLTKCIIVHLNSGSVSAENVAFYSNNVAKFYQAIAIQ
jgi:hypothetical protein